jgi:hypothetical protein
MATTSLKTLNDVLTYQIFSPQFHCEQAEAAKIAMAEALEELKRRWAQEESANGHNASLDGNHA